VFFSLQDVVYLTCRIAQNQPKGSKMEGSAFSPSAGRAAGLDGWQGEMALNRFTFPPSSSRVDRLLAFLTMDSPIKL